MPGNDGTIQSKLQLDGEQQYKKALNDAYRSLRVLRSELKAETAELGKNATQQDKDRVKTESLKKQIAEQEKVVKTLTKALEDSRKEYADNQEVQDKWQEKLNKAREALANMRNQLGDAESSVRKFGSSMKDAAEESKEAATHVVSLNESIKSIGNLVSGVGSGISGIFSGTLEAMEGMVDKMMELMGKAWSAAGEWKQIQSIWGGDVESIERVFTGAKLQGVESGDITAGIQKLVSNAHSKNKETIAALQQLGIDEKDFENHWDFYVATMQALADKDKDGKLTRMIFGDRTGSGQTDVVHNWNDMMAKYRKDVEDTGLHLYDDEIKELDDVSHKITEIQALWDTLQTSIGAKLVDILDVSGISDDVLNILRDVATLLNADGAEKKAEITVKLNDDLKSLIEKISKAAENAGGFLQEIGGALKTSDNSLISYIGDLMEKAGGLLDWLGEHGTELTDMLTKLLPWIMTNKLSEAVTGKGIGDWVSDIVSTGLSVWQITLLGKTFGSAAKAGIDATATGSAIGSAFSSTASTLLLNTLAAWASVEIFKALPADLIQRLNKWLFGESEADKVTEDIYAGKGIETMGDVIEDIQDTPQEQNQKSMAAMWDAFWNPGTPKEEPQPEESTGLSEDARRAADAYYDAYRYGEELVGPMADLKEAIPDETTLQALVDKIKDFFLDNDGTVEDLPSEWFTDTKHILEGMKAPEGWFSNVQAALENLSKDKYTGDKKEQQQPITIQLTANSYIDGELVSSQVSRQIYNGFNHRFMG